MGWKVVEDIYLDTSFVVYFTFFLVNLIGGANRN